MSASDSFFGNNFFENSAFDNFSFDPSLSGNPFTDPSFQALLDDLKESDPQVRQQATESLWHRWFCQKGAMGLEQISQSQQQMEQEDWEGAEKTLTQLIDALPDFAEAWNRRAVLYYSQERYPEAIADCESVVRLVPAHFGAWHGMGLCQMALGDYRQAMKAFDRALTIQPYGILNRKLSLECHLLLS